LTSGSPSHPVELWCAFCARIGEESLLSRYRALLSASEQEQAGKFHFARDGHRYLVTRALVRTTLSRYAPIDPADWRFETTRYGRPYITNEEPLAQGLCFNVTHSGDLVLLAVSRQREIGIDAEDTQARSPALAIADRYFAPPEVRALRALAPAEQPQRFFEYWTLKESYIKARGKGLSVALDQFSFEFSGAQRVELSVQPQLQDAAARWQLWQLWIEPSYVVAVCAERPAQPPVLTEVVPLVSECSRPFTLLRSSR
jgi:4'-phosphopantetheinyl transferase